MEDESDESAFDDGSSISSERPAKGTAARAKRPMASAPATTNKKTQLGGDKSARLSDALTGGAASTVQNDEGGYLDAEDVNIGGGFMTHEEILDARPRFLLDAYIRDANGRRPDDPEYDPTTLYIPAEAWKTFTPAKAQYWQIKSTNFEKILLFKLGKFYEMFDNDAIVCQKLLDLNWMGGAKKLHVGFPEKALDKYLGTLVSQGYKVAVIEQTETPKQMEERQRQEKGVKKEKCVKRDICNVVSKGTYKDPSANAGYEPKYVLSLRRCGQILGVTFFDLSTLRVFVGQFEDDEPLSNLRTLICQIRPVEVLFERELAESEVIKMLKNTPVVPVFRPLMPKDCWGLIKTLARLEAYFGSADKLPPALAELRKNDADLALTSLGMAIAFMEEALVADMTVATADYTVYTPETQAVGLDYMVLDSQALQHLEIVESGSGRFEGSLLHYVDHCKTPFGRRLLKRWLLSPLTDLKRIAGRQDAVQDLV
jgi:DNA mismatch repair protein MSH6